MKNLNAKTQNHFLDELSENRNVIQKRNIHTTLISGDGEETIKFSQVVPSHSKEKWIDGKVVGDITTKFGDGNVITNSVFLLDGDKYIVQGAHNAVLYKCIPILQRIL